MVSRTVAYRIQRSLSAGTVLLGMALAGFEHRVPAATGQEGKIDYNFQVRPILSDRCFKCHGPDEKARKAKLRLDLPESALAVRDFKKGTRAIISGHPEQSELYRRITSDDEEERMPPA